jgi:hypothetical protein
MIKPSLDAKADEKNDEHGGNTAEFLEHAKRGDDEKLVRERIHEFSEDAFDFVFPREVAVEIIRHAGSGERKSRDDIERVALLHEEPNNQRNQNDAQRGEDVRKGTEIEVTVLRGVRAFEHFVSS